VIIGDLDSISDRVLAHYQDPNRLTDKKTLIIKDSSQDSTDFGKAVSYIRDNRREDEPVQDIVAVGGLGGRVDQGISQLHHLYSFQKDAGYADGKMYLFSGESVTFLLKGVPESEKRAAGGGADGDESRAPKRHHRIRVRDPTAAFALMRAPFGKYVGFLPLGQKNWITTKGLEWDVEDWETEIGGLLSTSNHTLPETEVVDVWTRHDILFTIAVK